MKLRSAVKEDCCFLYHLRNEKEVRKNSCQSDFISYEEHQAWFQKKLADSNTHIFILELDGTRVGQVRVDISEERAVISYALSPEVRGKGYAKWMLSELEGRVRDNLWAYQMEAKVKEENKASQRIFRVLGYQEQQTDFGYYYVKRIPVFMSSEAVGVNMEKKRIAIITARGGSKRIPRKNVKEFCGRPIIAYSIAAALESGCFDTVMVSTDDEEIARISRSYGAEVPFMRSEKTSGDFATTADVILEVLDEYEKRREKFAYAACIYPTAPFVTANKLRDGMRRLEEKQGTMLMPVTVFSFPPQRGMVKKGDYVEYCYPQCRNSRSQDLEPMYHDCGQFYCYDVEKYRRTNGQIDGGIIPYFISELEVQDIDNETDWKIAELKYRMMQE